MAEPNEGQKQDPEPYVDALVERLEEIERQILGITGTDVAALAASLGRDNAKIVMDTLAYVFARTAHITSTIKGRNIARRLMREGVPWNEISDTITTRHQNEVQEMAVAAAIAAGEERTIWSFNFDAPRMDEDESWRDGLGDQWDA